jgi:hypothetical protein
MDNIQSMINQSNNQTDNQKINQGNNQLPPKSPLLIRTLSTQHWDCGLEELELSKDKGINRVKIGEYGDYTYFLERKEGEEKKGGNKPNDKHKPCVYALTYKRNNLIQATKMKKHRCSGKTLNGKQCKNRKHMFLLQGVYLCKKHALHIV